MAERAAAITNIESARELRIEIETIEALHGPNPYSHYLRKHGRRPNRAEAAGIGLVIGGRVRADDGTMQPSLTAVDRSASKQASLQRRTFARRQEQITRLRIAIAALSKNQDDPANLIRDGNYSLDAPELVAQLDAAVDWLNRFAEHWHGRTQEAGTKKLGSRVGSQS